tara:strand:+ start:116 stop:376 length:261 start_codon:yes stop_codon:yes gene_type:complete
MLLRALEGSLKIPSATLSHHLETSPIACSEDAGFPHPNIPITAYPNRNRIQIRIARKVYCCVICFANNWYKLEGVIGFAAGLKQQH